jgi:hypothetical protein
MKKSGSGLRTCGYCASLDISKPQSDGFLNGFYCPIKNCTRAPGAACYPECFTPVQDKCDGYKRLKK